MIKAIIFDCFGVLTQDSWRVFCSELPEGEILNKAHELNRRYNAALISTQQFIELIHELTGKNVDLVANIVNNSDSHKNVELLNYIKEKKPNYKIGLISNIGTNWIRDSFLNSKEQELFDAMIMSFEIGFTKPDPKIYELAAARLGAKLDECVFVDDIASYVTAAEQTGMKGIVYQDFNKFKTELEKILATDANN